MKSIEVKMNKTYKIEDSIHEKFKKVCNKNGKRHSEVIREMIVKYIAEGK